ncbi:helix-turn-helix domain-containing protein [Bdellovibrio sp.]|uniref:helix-turn-helix domain-containing protein n=1 Tax=Bdellovibrio sp. TaxID=28201 RepID=UPI0039E6CFA1
MSLGKHLSRIMKERGLSLAALSKASGVSKQTIHGWTAGRRVHDISQLKKVATVLKMPLHDLLFGEPDPFLSAPAVILKELFSGDIRVTIHKIEERS